MQRSKKVLVVEDDKGINELVFYNLKKEGFLVRQAFDGCQAEKIIAEEDGFDIVILDIMLPFKDGFELCRQIKEGGDAYRTFVIIISAKGAPQDKLYAHLLGADYYLAKPFSIKALLSIVRELDNIKKGDFLIKRR
ncbi:MAG: response regulator [Candidatus Omnitrophota bacterium]